MQDLYVNRPREREVVAMAYVPWQHLDKIYENLNEALKVGTLFPELNKPFVGRSVKRYES